MDLNEHDRISWAISRLRTMPDAAFYGSVISLFSSSRGVSSLARTLLNLPDRGGLQTVTFQTMRTYLSLLNNLLLEWGRQFPQPDLATNLLQEAQEWLKTRTATGSKSEVQNDASK